MVLRQGFQVQKKTKKLVEKPNTKNYQAERPREKKHFDRKPHRERQKFPAKFVGYGHRTDPSCSNAMGSSISPVMKNGHLLSNLNNYYRGNRRRDTQYKRKKTDTCTIPLKVCREMQLQVEIRL